jgi:uncharacterized protein YxjI
MESESYYEIVAENTRTGDVEKRVVICRVNDAQFNRDAALRVFKQLRKAGYNLIEGTHVEVNVMKLEWLSHGDV